MEFVLQRKEFRDDGIFSELSGNGFIAQTLEHSYNKLPKIPDGTYTCVRGQHQLHGMSRPFSTFEVTNVPGHSGILIHQGNWNDDSDGCILVGEELAQSPKGQMITASIITFNKLMALLDGVNSFTLIVKS